MSKTAPTLEPLVLSDEQACQLLGITRNTLRKLVEQGEIDVVRLGRHVKFRRSDLERFVSDGGTDRIVGRAYTPADER